MRDLEEAVSPNMSEKHKKGSMAGAQGVDAGSRGSWRDGQELGEATEGLKQGNIGCLCI